MNFNYVMSVKSFKNNFTDFVIKGHGQSADISIKTSVRGNLILKRNNEVLGNI